MSLLSQTVSNCDTQRNITLITKLNEIYDKHVKTEVKPITFRFNKPFMNLIKTVFLTGKRKIIIVFVFLIMYSLTLFPILYSVSYNLSFITAVDITFILQVVV